MRRRHSVPDAAKPRSSLLVHACGRQLTGLKTHRGSKRKAQLPGCSGLARRGNPVKGIVKGSRDRRLHDFAGAAGYLLIARLWPDGEWVDPWVFLRALVQRHRALQVFDSSIEKSKQIVPVLPEALSVF